MRRLPKRKAKTKKTAKKVRTRSLSHGPQKPGGTKYDRRANQ